MIGVGLVTSPNLLIGFSVRPSLDEELRGEVKIVRCYRYDHSSASFEPMPILAAETEFQPGNRISKETTYSSNGLVAQHDVWEYAGDDEPTRIRMTDGRGVGLGLKEIWNFKNGSREIRTLDVSGSLIEHVTNHYDTQGRLVYEELRESVNCSVTRMSIHYSAEGTYAITSYDGGPFDGMRVELQRKKQGETVVVYDRSGSAVAQTGTESYRPPGAAAILTTGNSINSTAETVEEIDARDQFGNWTRRSIYLREPNSLPGKLIALWERRIVYYDS